MGLKPSPVPCKSPFLIQSIKSYRPVALTSRTNFSGTRRIVVEGDTPSRVSVPGIERIYRGRWVGSSEDAQVMVVRWLCGYIIDYSPVVSLKGIVINISEVLVSLKTH